MLRWLMIGLYAGIAGVNVGIAGLSPQKQPWKGLHLAVLYELKPVRNPMKLIFKIAGESR